jgi:hypothetical protein
MEFLAIFCMGSGLFLLCFFLLRKDRMYRDIKKQKEEYRRNGGMKK